MFINRGEVFSIIGPNGAGKTTLIKIIATLVLPTSGHVSVNGFDVVRDESEVRRIIGLSTGYERSFYYRLTGEQNLFFFGGLYGINGRILRDRVGYLLDRFKLSEYKDVKYMKYSTGMKKKLSLARALLHNPEICIFDEPLSSVDPESVLDIISFIQQLRNEGKTILMASHNLAEIEKFSDRIAIMNAGKIVKIGTVLDLEKDLGVKVVEINNVHQKDMQIIEDYLRIFNVKKFKAYKGKLSFYVNETNSIPDILLFLKSKGILPSMIEIRNPELEEAFISVLRHQKC